MPPLAIINADVWDGDAASAVPATVVIDGNTIQSVIPGRDLPADLPADRIDGSGMTLMPGLVEGHCHPSFVGIAEPPELGRIPAEEHMLRTAANLRLLLDHGFTAIFEAASAKPLLGVTARTAIDSGLIAGPRMLAASPEITTTAGLGDERRRAIHQESFGLIADGADEMRRVTRECVRDGVDVLKLNISGDEFVRHARAEITPTEDEEVAAFARVAKAFGKVTAVHARSSQSVKMAVRHGIDCIYHCDFADTEAIDMLEAVKDRVFLGPAFGLVHNVTREGSRFGITEQAAADLGLHRKFDACCATYHEVRKRGIRVVIGGDYGFAMTPMGENARDIEHFVRHFGYTPVEALRCATVVGADLMGLGDRIGRIRPGFLADLLLVTGDPTRDVSRLQHRDNLAMIMKDGRLWKDPRRGAATGAATGAAAGLIQAAE